MTTALASDPIPLRALNQVCYCPRLYYLQYVDCVMPINEHVAGGQFDHRRVTNPDLTSRSRKEGDAVLTRSVHLSSERLGLTGVLDMVEEKAGELYPVETKHGSAPRGDDGNPTFWDNDAVQLCAQGLLLEEEYGHPIPMGFLYYAGSRERVPVNLDESLRQKTLDAIRSIRDISSRDAPPEPLAADQRHKCYGCSLAPVCQPEETLYQIERRDLPADSAPPAGITRVVPQTDEGAVLYLQEPGSYVGKRSEHLVIRKDGQELNRIPLHAIRQVVVFGNVQLSTQALECLTYNEIPVIFLTGYGRFIAALEPAPRKNVSLREAQFRRFADTNECLQLSCEVVRAKLMNQRTLLMRCLRDDDTPGRDEPAARDLAELLRRLENVTDLSVILGMEGQGAALYFGEFSRFLKAPPPGERGFDFTHRNRRPPRDPINALLSFAYALLCKDCFSAVCTVGFDPYRGFFHAGRHGKPSLALDLMEEFRAIIADSVVLTLVNTRTITADDFVQWRDACQLTEAGRKKFFGAYEQRMAAMVTHPVYGYKMSYARMIEVQARTLAAYLRGDIPRYTGFTVR
jgi:CRISPR-associated protein Cas1